jgi:hypothetical protein
MMDTRSEHKNGIAIVFILAPVMALVGLIYFFAWVDADFVIGGKGLF